MVGRVKEGKQLSLLSTAEGEREVGEEEEGKRRGVERGLFGDAVQAT